MGRGSSGISGGGAGGSFISKLNETLAESSNPDKSERMKARRSFAKYLDQNATFMESMVNTGEHFIGVTDNNAWYQNNAGTLFLLGSDNYWHKLGNDLILYRDHKISQNEKQRIKKLLGV